MTVYEIRFSTQYKTKGKRPEWIDSGTQWVLGNGDARGAVAKAERKALKDSFRGDNKEIWTAVRFRLISVSKAGEIDVR